MVRNGSDPTEHCAPYDWWLINRPFRMVPPSAALADAPSPAGPSAFKEPVKDTILTPRFYTTDFEAMAAMDLRPNEVELEAICEEFRKDYNRHHFVRDSAFEGAAEKLDPDTRRVFVEFLDF